MNLSKIEYKELKQQLLDMIEKDWTGKKGYWTDSSMFRYTKFYTEPLKNQVKKAS